MHKPINIWKSNQASLTHDDPILEKDLVNAAGVRIPVILSLLY